MVRFWTAHSLVSNRQMAWPAAQLHSKAKRALDCERPLQGSRPGPMQGGAARAQHSKRHGSAKCAMSPGDAPNSEWFDMLAPMSTSNPGGAEAHISGRGTQVSLITVSYRGDLELARDLCASIDRFADPEIEHVLVVPRSDTSLFLPLITGNRRLIAVESVLPNGYVKLPLPRHIAIGSYRRLIREIWWAPTGPVRGWIVQQILKLSAPTITRRDVVVFADSDIVLVRPVSASLFSDADGVRLYRVPGATEDSAMHQRWHTVSARLLGLDHKTYFGADYIGNLITWRRDVILQLQDRLTLLAGKRWDKVIAREAAFSEYILYGIFAEHLLGLPKGGHFSTGQDLVHAGWHYALNTPTGLHEFIEGFEPSHVGIAIQSTERFTLEERRSLIRRTASSV
jgi:Family of unknown function (DUF6492)